MIVFWIHVPCHDPHGFRVYTRLSVQAFEGRVECMGPAKPHVRVRDW